MLYYYQGTETISQKCNTKSLHSHRFVNIITVAFVRMSFIPMCVVPFITRMFVPSWFNSEQNVVAPDSSPQLEAIF